MTAGAPGRLLARMRKIEARSGHPRPPHAPAQPSLFQPTQQKGIHVTDPCAAVSSRPLTGPGAADWLRDVAAELTAAGIPARVDDTLSVPDLTAEAPALDGGKPSEVVADPDGYTEIRYWNDPEATPAQVSAVIVRALAAIHAARRNCF